MTVHKVHLDDSLNTESLELPNDIRRNLIRYLSHVPITSNMDTKEYMIYQVKALQSFGFTPEMMTEKNYTFNLFCDILRKHYDCVTEGKFYDNL